LFKDAENSGEKLGLALKLVDQLESRVKGMNSGLTPAECVEEDVKLEFELDDLLRVMIKHGASDLHLKPDVPPTVRLDGELVPIGDKPLTITECRQLVSQF